MCRFSQGENFSKFFSSIRRCIPLLSVSVLFFQLQRVITLEFHSFYYEINSYFVFIFVFSRVFVAPTFVFATPRRLRSTLVGLRLTPLIIYLFSLCSRDHILGSVLLGLWLPQRSYRVEMARQK